MLDEPERLEAVHRRVKTGDLKLYVTHVQWDEVAALQDDPKRRANLLTLLRQLRAEELATAGFVWDRSRLDMARLLSDEDAERHRAYVGKSTRRSADALLLATPAAEDLVFVTEERKPRNLVRMRRYFPGVEILSLEALTAR